MHGGFIDAGRRLILLNPEGTTWTSDGRSFVHRDLLPYVKVTSVHDNTFSIIGGFQIGTNQVNQAIATVQETLAGTEATEDEIIAKGKHDFWVRLRNANQKIIMEKATTSNGRL